MDKIVSFMILYENYNSIPTVQTTKACTQFIIFYYFIKNTHFKTSKIHLETYARDCCWFHI